MVSIGILISDDLAEVEADSIPIPEVVLPGGAVLHNVHLAMDCQVNEEIERLMRTQHSRRPTEDFTMRVINPRGSLELRHTELIEFYRDELIDCHSVFIELDRSHEQQME